MVRALPEGSQAGFLDEGQPWPAGVSLAGVAEGFSTEAPISLYGATKLASERLAQEYLLLVPVAWPDIVFRKMALVAGAVLLALGLETFHYEHYTAPAWAALALMFALWSERAWNFRIGNKRAGAALVLLVLGSPLIFAGKPLSSSASLWPAPRAALIRRLSALGRRQLVIVRYPSPDWRVGNEWVYNGADIDSQQVVFAHDLGVERNRMLLDYYPERAPLLLTFDGTTGQDHLEPYPR